MKKLAFVWCSTLLFPFGAFASGWNDYTLEIAPGFTIVRANTFDVCITVEHQSNETPVNTCPAWSPQGWSAHGIGPLAAYVVTPDQVLARHLGVRPHERNPQLPDGDPSKEFFFIMSRPTHQVVGPLSRIEFENHPLRRRGEIDWKEPRNPNILLPLFGSLVFISVLLSPLFLVLLLVRLWYVRRRQATRQSAA